MLPPQVTPVGGRPSNFVEGRRRITNDPYVLSIVAKGYSLRFTSPPLLRQSFTSRVQGLGDSCSCTPSILPQGTKLYLGVPASGVTQLGFRSYPSGSFVPETPSTSFSFIRSDRPVYATASIRLPGPCQPTSAMAGPTFSYLRNPNPHISGGPYDFYERLQSGL